MAPDRDPIAPAAPAMTLWSLYEEAARRAPDQPAIISPDSDDFRVTYASLIERAEVAASALHRLGHAPGEPLALWASNLLTWPIYFLAGVRLGAIVTPVLPGAPRAHAEHILRSSEAPTLLMGPGRRGERVRLALEMMPALRTADRTALWDPAFPKLARVIMHTDETPAGAYAAKVLEKRADEEEEETTGGVLGRALGRLGGGRREAPAETEPARDAHTPAALLFTAGTTGRLPAGALATHHALLSAGRETAERLELQPSDHVLMPVPFAHPSGLSLGLAAVATAGATVLPVFDPDPHRILLDVASAAPTVLVLTPRLLRSILDARELGATARDSVRTIVMTANPAQPALLEAAAAAFPNAAVVQAYGLAEAGGIVALGRRGDRAEERIGRIGRFFPTVEARVTDPGGTEVRPSEVGELALRGAPVAREYWRDRATTAAAIDAEGFLRTGDLVARDADGAIRFVGRSEDRIHTPHGPVDPREVEGFLASLDRAKVQEAWVVGVPSRDGGAGAQAPGSGAEPAGTGDGAGEPPREPAEIIVAAVKLAPGATMTEAEFLEQTAQWLPPHKRPTRVLFVDEVPTGPAGAVLRHRLREQLAALLEPSLPAARGATATSRAPAEREKELE